jgi:cholesterol transport system auxiliary component
LFLQRRLAGGGTCRLRVDLDEFLQVFDSPQASLQIMAVRASLSLGTTVVDRGSFVIEQQATSPDARGSVAAASLATSQLADQLAAWLAQRRETCRSTPADH